jgi:Phosphotransferase enzyme family
MAARTGEDWLALCTLENRLQIPLRRHLHHVEDYVVKVSLAAQEPDEYGDFNDPIVARLLDDNAKLISTLVASSTTIPIPQLIQDGYVSRSYGLRYFTIWTYIPGYSLKDKWDHLGMPHKERIMDQLHGYTLQLRGIENPLEHEFAVGTLCSIHTLLNDPGILSQRENFWHNNGPFKTVAQYREKVEELYAYSPNFLAHENLVLDHMDWFRCNVLINEKADVVCLVDREKAGFIPSRKDNFLGGLTIEDLQRRHPWPTLFDERFRKLNSV